MKEDEDYQVESTENFTMEALFKNDFWKWKMCEKGKTQGHQQQHKPKLISIKL